MAAAAANAFEGPSQIMARQFGPRSTLMHGAGGQAGTEDKGQTATVKDAEAQERGDATWQLQVQAHPTGIGSSQGVERSSSAGLTAKAGSMMQSLKEAASQAMPASMHVGRKVSTGGCPFMTSVFGFPMQDPSKTLQIAGHPVISDVVSLEKQQHFNRQKTLERAVHACGSGALGYFITTHDMSKYTKAELFHGVGTRTPVAARFSTTTFGREFPDEARNPRGLAFKFYTPQGNYDIMSINFPSFFVRDGALGPDAIRSQQRNPNNFQVSFDSVFDFMALVPESMLANLWFWSDHGTPRGWMHMDGYPIHAFKWVNAAGEVTFIKYRLLSAQGIQNLSQAEAQRVSGVDPDFSKRELWQHIHSGKTAEWILQVQLLTHQDIAAFTTNPFDCSRPWPEDKFPWHEVGRIVMDKNVENYHRDTEQIAFSPGRLVPGIEPTPDPLLQWRCFLYLDAQMHRLGANYHQIPVNAPWRVDAYHPVTRDGVMRLDANGGHEPHYYPNSHPHQVTASTTAASSQAPGCIAPVPDPDSKWSLTKMPDGAVLSRGPFTNTEGDPVADYLPARDFWLTLSQADQLATCQNIAYSLRTVSRMDVVARWLLACQRTHESLAAGILAALATECQRAGQQPPITAQQLAHMASQLNGKPLVDTANGYQPVPLPHSA